MTVFDVTQFGAVPMPGVDNFRAIQAAADAWKRHGGRMHFPRGTYEISQTIDIGGKSREVGGCVTCDGPLNETINVAHDINTPIPETSVTQNGTVLVWRGKDNGGPMLRYAGTHLVWDGPTLRGDYSGKMETGNRPSSGLELHFLTGLGSGMMDIRQLNGSRMPILLHANGSANTDQFDVKRFLMYDVDVGFRSESPQNVGSLFGFVTAQHVSKAVFSFANLTHTTVQHANMNYAVKSFVRTEESDYMAGSFSCNSMKVDPECSEMLLVDASDKPHTFGTYSFRDVTGYSKAPSIKANGGVIITLDNCRSLYGPGYFDLAGSPNAECQVLITRSHLPNALHATDLVKGDGKHCRVTIKDCFGDKNAPRPDEYAVGGQLIDLSDLQLVGKQE